MLDELALSGEPQATQQARPKTQQCDERREQQAAEDCTAPLGLRKQSGSGHHEPPDEHDQDRNAEHEFVGTDHKPSHEGPVIGQP